MSTTVTVACSRLPVSGDNKKSGLTTCGIWSAEVKLVVDPARRPPPFSCDRLTENLEQATVTVPYKRLIHDVNDTDKQTSNRPSTPQRTS